MATKEELYISASYSKYKAIKSSVLMSQVEMLQILKKLHHLKMLARQKRDLKKTLHKLSASLVNQINSLQERLPNPKLPKVIQKTRKQPKPLFEKKEKKILTKQDQINEELRLINEKIKSLNI